MITVVQTPAHTFAGEWSEVTKILKNPRAMQVKQTGPNEIRVVFLKIIGDPPELAIHAPVASYELTDKGLCDYYRSEVSGIHLVPAGAMPHIPQGVK